MGGYLAGEIGALYGEMSKVSFFILVMVVGSANGVAMCLLVPCINRTLDRKQLDAMARGELDVFVETELNEFETIPSLVPTEEGGAKAKAHIRRT
jgi:hypothetical protein